MWSVGDNFPRVLRYWNNLLSPGLISQSVEKEAWARFTDTSKADTSSISSEAESVDDVWSITDEQREYYTNQFRSMHADLAGKISGRNDGDSVVLIGPPVI